MLEKFSGVFGFISALLPFLIYYLSLIIFKIENMLIIKFFIGFVYLGAVAAVIFALYALYNWVFLNKFSFINFSFVILSLVVVTWIYFASKIGPIGRGIL